MELFRDIAVWRKEEELQSPVKFRRTVYIRTAVHPQPLMRGVSKKLFRCVRQVGKCVRLVQKGSVTAEERKSAVGCERMKRKDLRDAVRRHTAEEHSDPVFQAWTGIMAVLELFGKTEIPVFSVYKNILA